MKNIATAFLVLSLFTTSSIAQSTMNNDPDEVKATILHLDSIFWNAYNHCDVEVMHSYLSDDLEFYHDKGGVTRTADTLIAMTRSGLCGNPNWRLRRAAVPGTVKVYTMDDYGAIISGEHLFYINEQGKDEYLDGHALFTHLWHFVNNEWKMTRVLSYDHKPAPEQFHTK